MNAQQPPGLPPFDPMEITWIAIVKARWKILAATGLGAALGLVAGLARPNLYTSVGKFRVDAGQLASVMDTSLSGGGAGSTPQGLRATREEVVDELEILYSPDIIGAVAETVGTEAILRPADPSAFDNQWTPEHIRLLHRFQGWVLSSLGGPSQGSDWERKERAQLALFERTFVNSIRGSNVIIVSHTSPHPDVAQLVVREYMKAGEAQHVEVFAQDPREREELRELGSVLRERLRIQEEGFRDHKLECGFQDLEQSTSSLTSRITQLQSELRHAEAELAELDASYGAAQKMVRDEPAYIQQSEQSLVDNPDWVAANDVYINLQRAVTEMEMAAVGPGARNPDDPAYRGELADLMTRRGLAKAQRDAMDPKVLGPETMRRQPNPAFANAQRTVADYPGRKAAAEARLLGARTQGEKAIMDLDAAHRCAGTHESFSGLITGLKDEIVKNDGEYAVAVRRTQNEARGKTNLRRISEASLPLEKDGPRRSKSILIGLFLGLFGAAGLAVLLEVLNRRLRRPVEVERLLGVRVLAAMPECKGWAKRGRVERSVIPREVKPSDEGAAEDEKPKAEVSA